MSVGSGSEYFDSRHFDVVLYLYGLESFVTYAPVHRSKQHIITGFGNTRMYIQISPGHLRSPPWAFVLCVAFPCTTGLH